MHGPSQILRRLALIAAIPLLIQCTGSSQDKIEIDVIAAEGDPFEAGMRLGPAGQLVRAGIAEGLVDFDGEGRVIPGLADRWIVTEDGLSYIFRLRDVSWGDGTPISGEAARDALRQAIGGLNGTPLGRDLGAISDIRAMTGRVLELRLSHPVPDLLDLLAQPELALLRRGKGNGAFQLKREGPLALLTPIAPERRGLPEIPGWKDEARPVYVHGLPIKAAIARFSAGKNSAVLGGRIETFPAARDAAGIGQGALRMDPVVGLMGLTVAGSDGMLANADLREAVAMAIDRDALANDLGIRGWTGTSRIVPPNAPDAPGAVPERWAGNDMTRRRAEASARVNRWHARGGKTAALRLALPDGPGTDILYRRIESDMAAIGITLSRVPAEAPADLRLMDSVARYARADWYLGQLACGITRGLCSARADTAANAARTQPDPAKRAALLAEAEQALIQTNGFIPLGSPVRWSLVRDPLPGFATNARGWHPLAALILPAN